MRAALAALALALFALPACGKYGPPVRPKPTPAHGPQATPVPATTPSPAPSAPNAAPGTSDTEQCPDPNAVSAGAKP
jgi:hypothetical protein